ncbi:MAG: hypothetical protein JXA89_18620 [Anaerolineae bacterium]|nr:hypothetical protein [Anaerolineae bacterium]
MAIAIAVRQRPKAASVLPTLRLAAKNDRGCVAQRPDLVDGGFRPWTFVKVETNEPGLVGWGDCTDWGSPGLVAATVVRYAGWVVGRDPMQAEAI